MGEQELFYAGTFLVIGAAGSGKTQHAKALIDKYDLKGIIDEWHYMHGLACKHVHVTNAAPPAEWIKRFEAMSGNVERM
jgi:MoxR-like ATPase